MKVAGQPRMSDRSSSGGRLLCVRGIFTVTVCATLHSAWAEDRALLGSNPSAVPGPEAVGEFVLDGSPRFFMSVALIFILLLWAVMR